MREIVYYKCEYLNELNSLIYQIKSETKILEIIQQLIYSYDNFYFL